MNLLIFLSLMGDSFSPLHHVLLVVILDFGLFAMSRDVFSTKLTCPSRGVVVACVSCPCLVPWILHQAFKLKWPIFAKSVLPLTHSKLHTST